MPMNVVIQRLLQRAGFALPVADAELLTVTYPDMFRLMADIRAMGGQNCLIGRTVILHPGLSLWAAALYKEKFTDSAVRLRSLLR